MSPVDHLTAALESLGFLADPEAQGTPERVIAFLRDHAPGRPPPVVEPLPSPGGEAVVLRGLPFHSLCVHHLLPFFGEADVAYRPAGTICGLGAIGRVLRHHARQPQLQERLGVAVADQLHLALGAPVAVRLRARQMCMEMRGVESAGTVETLALRGEGAGALVGLWR